MSFEKGKTGEKPPDDLGKLDSEQISYKELESANISQEEFS